GAAVDRTTKALPGPLAVCPCITPVDAEHGKVGMMLGVPLAGIAVAKAREEARLPAARRRGGLRAGSKERRILVFGDFGGIDAIATDIDHARPPSARARRPRPVDGSGVLTLLSERDTRRIRNVGIGRGDGGNPGTHEVEPTRDAPCRK